MCFTQLVIYGETKHGFIKKVVSVTLSIFCAKFISSCVQLKLLVFVVSVNYSHQFTEYVIARCSQFKENWTLQTQQIMLKIFLPKESLKNVKFLCPLKIQNTERSL